MDLFFRIFQHLFPRSAAWTLFFGSMLRDFVMGLAGTPSDARTFIDLVFLDIFPTTTRQVSDWETQFGLTAAADDSTRRLNLTAAWQAMGGQSPSYLQNMLQAAGFPLYIHEWWEDPTARPRVPHDPRLYTNEPLIGTNRCRSTSLAPRCRSTPAAPRCNGFLANDVGYLVNLNLTDVAPPPVPSDPKFWPYFLYFGGETFPERVSIPSARRGELERLLLKLCPMQQWIVTLIDYTSMPSSSVELDGDAAVLDGNSLSLS